MNRKQLNVVVPVVYAILIVATVLFFDKALVPVAVIGAMLVGLYFATIARGVEGGRERNRNRNR